MEVVHDGIKYRWDEEERVYSVLPNGYKGEIIIPAYVKTGTAKIPVVSVETDAFFDCTELTAITLPDGLKKIGISAFENCSQLKDIYIPDSVNEIGMCAFQDCRSLEHIRLPKWLHELPIDMLEDCISLVDVIMPKQVKVIESAFHGCESLERIDLPEGVEELGMGAFDGCRALKDISLPSSLHQLGIYAFANCSQLQRIVIPEGVTYIPMGCFRACSRLSELVLPTTIWDIHPDALNGTAWMDKQEDGLVYYNDLLFTWKGKLPNNGNVVVRDGTRIICDDALLNCTTLRSIVLPTSLRYIREQAFSCTCLQQILLPEGLEEIQAAAFEFCLNLQSITIPASVRLVGEFLFTGCNQLKTIEVNPDNPIYDSRNSCNAIILKWDNCLVAGCANTHIPNSIKSIGKGAFMDIVMPEKLILPNSVTTIERCAFCMCTNIKEIVFPKHLMEIGDSAFDDTGWWYQQPAGAVYINNILYKYKPHINLFKREPDCVVREGTEQIAECAFQELKLPLRVILPNETVLVHKFACVDVEELVELITIG